VFSLLGTEQPVPERLLAAAHWRAIGAVSRDR
jgi:hypothetical protein